MKVLIIILIVIGVIFGVWKVWDYWETVDQQREAEQVQLNAVANSGSFAGLPQQLERPLREALKQGPQALKQFLDYNRPLIKDPRLAAIELDYVLLISREDPVEAKKVFAKVKERIPEDSPLYKRIQALARTYE